MKTVSLELAKQLKEAGIEWRDIDGFEGLYQVSNNGQVRSLARPTTFDRVLKPVLRGGYHCVSLSKKGLSRQIHIHTLVASAFVSRLFGRTFINHKDGNKLNNRSGNLEWCTRSENDLHAYRTGLRKPTQGEKNGQARLTGADIHWIYDHSAEFTQKQIANRFGVSNQHVSDILTGKKWRHIYESRNKETV